MEADLAAGRHAELVGELQRARPASTRGGSGCTPSGCSRSTAAAARRTRWPPTARPAPRLVGRARPRARRGAARARAADARPRPGARRPASRPLASPPRAAPRGAAARRPPRRQRPARRARPRSPSATRRCSTTGSIALWDACAAAIERHGGAVEAGGGDAVVGLFGLERAQEDDALRAARAAAGRDARGRRAADRRRRRRGVRRRRLAAAGAGAPERRSASRRRSPRPPCPARSCVGDRARRLAAAAVRVEPLEPMPGLEPKAWRLLELSGDGGRGPAGVRLAVRRPRARARAAARDRAPRPRASGPAAWSPSPAGRASASRGSRASSSRRSASAAGAVTGRCAPYGQGCSFDALAEIVRALAGDDLAAALGGDEAAAAKLRAATGLGSEPGAAGGDRLGRAAAARARRAPSARSWSSSRTSTGPRRACSTCSSTWPRSRPGRRSCCCASHGPSCSRPARRGRRASATAPSSRSTRCPRRRSRALVEAVGPGGARRRGSPRRRRATRCSPSSSRPSGGAGEAPARACRRCWPRASTGSSPASGRCSPAPPSRAAASTPARSPRCSRRRSARSSPSHLLSLVRRRLVDAEPTELEGEDAFRFTHALIRDAAYDGAAEARCARSCTSAWRRGWSRARGRRTRSSATTSSRRAGSARSSALARPGRRAPPATSRSRGRRARSLRGDPRAAAALLERAVDAARRPAARRGPRCCRGSARRCSKPAASPPRASSSRRRPRRPTPPSPPAAGSSASSCCLQTDPATDPDGVPRRRGRGAARARRRRRRRRAARGSCARGWTGPRAVRPPPTTPGAAPAEHAAAAHDERERFEMLCWRASAAAFGPEPVDAAIARCEAIRDEVRASPVAVAATLHPLAALHAMRGEPDARAPADPRGQRDPRRRSAACSPPSPTTRRWSSCWPATRPRAEARLRLGFDALREMGERGLLATTAAMLAQAVLAQGRDEEAGELAAVAATAAPREDLATQAIWRGAQRTGARAIAGAPCEAAALAHEAVALLAPTDLAHASRRRADGPRRGRAARRPPGGRRGRRTARARALRSQRQRRLGRPGPLVARRRPRRPDDGGRRWGSSRSSTGRRPTATTR